MGALYRTAGGLALLLAALAPRPAWAGNSERVLGGAEVALTGGSVVANVHGGAALWFNPAGIAELNARSFDLTGAVLSYTLIRAPGTLTVENGPASDGKYAAFEAIPRALSFVGTPRPKLRFGLGLFFSRTENRFWQDSVTAATQPGMGTSTFQSSTQRRTAIYHASAAVAWRQSDKLQIGGGLDAVFAWRRFAQTRTAIYDEGMGGAFNFASNERIAGGGLQAKFGIQSRPIDALRLGWMVASPSYLVYLDEERTETTAITPPMGEPEVTGGQVDRLRGTFSPVEPGLTRVGAAYLGKHGWLEADVIVSFPMRAAALGLDYTAKADVQLGGILEVADRLKLGAGLFTDFGRNRNLEHLGDNRVDFYGFTIGSDFSNRGDFPLMKGKDVYIAIAAAFRYAFGVGQGLGMTFTETFPTPSDIPETPTRVDVRMHEMGVNFAFKAGF